MRCRRSLVGSPRRRGRAAWGPGRRSRVEADIADQGRHARRLTALAEGRVQCRDRADRVGRDLIDRERAVVLIAGDGRRPCHRYFRSRAGTHTDGADVRSRAQMLADLRCEVHGPPRRPDLDPVEASRDDDAASGEVGLPPPADGVARCAVRVELVSAGRGGRDVRGSRDGFGRRRQARDRGRRRGAESDVSDQGRGVRRALLAEIRVQQADRSLRGEADLMDRERASCAAAIASPAGQGEVRRGTEPALDGVRVGAAPQGGAARRIQFDGPSVGTGPHLGRRAGRGDRRPGQSDRVPSVDLVAGSAAEAEHIVGHGSRAQTRGLGGVRARCGHGQGDRRWGRQERQWWRGD